MAALTTTSVRAVSAVSARKANFAGSRASFAAPAKAPVSARASLKVQAANRELWLKDSTVAPAHLDGTLPGDFGFDPLGLGADPERLKYYQEAELMNARWAMMAVAGICTTEILGIGGPWYEAGAAEYDLPINALLAVQFPVMGILELRRIRGWLATGKSGVNETFPWDPMGMNGDQMALKEVKNGRLAMIAFVGIVVQAIVYRTGPVAALKDHITDPFGCNMATNIMHIGSTF
ncbi:chlorophyll a/b-binding protein, psi-associated, chloroplast precursor [Micromonas commoda]|jgi:light-harvesting complex I chlorophyll a/b binding protein 5|uniref:Chlorophyll a-b binding protein, chloroplastic n=1 Tax=Micromonas commoda (strain RCC299 / NOUM17 / CCMP2709) TaxID=296587 RepID=C1E6S8_MICCC|nr:chlorophyll a/b-binding protein, psi-associated, chloroplast precursor [Micromonas commoda]ACO63487.1 chlorophyll a/b-binding protein, psi-associated, chloroplast precursor [Micromonas commoda]|mmetsp:Transcript_12431/g.52529  ORF Transcript_12431/g.52529 Transcript_12431/m.52529 type:complete len:234 (-) Transcript_12431:225-926(-)|eukprot:XP_002502229.1 chlorophyll a/b-binding protein, psi-associated, chloroplast precursor [Micromonas commoda]